MRDKIPIQFHVITCYQSRFILRAKAHPYVQFYFFFPMTDAYTGGICSANTTSGCLDENAECKDSICQCVMQYTNINGTCKAGKFDH